MTRPYRILVAENDTTSLVVLRRALEKAGHEVRTVGEGISVAEIAAQCHPDVILLDVTTLQHDGFSVCRDLKAQEDMDDIPVICMTSASDTAQIIQVFAAGGCDYLTKPFTVQEVLARIDIHVRLRRAEEELRLKNSRINELNNELADVCRIDPLTKLLNRRSWDEAIIQEHERSQRYGRSYSIIMIDVDHFKAYNDLYGRQTGDDCLRRIADTIVTICRRVELVGRYGGQEFVVLVPETNAEKAVKLADRIRRAIWGLAISHSNNIGATRITASLGVAVSDQAPWEDVLRRADNALYVAKRAGTNMVYADHGRPPKAQTVNQDKSSKESAELTTEDETNRISILVVDDDATNRAVCKGCLQRAGYQIREAEDGNAAISQVSENPPDLIIMDVMMPNMDGLECTRKLRANPETRDIPIIIVSAMTRTEDILSGLTAGADEYLSKPIRSSELILRVQSMARLRRERMDLLLSYEERGKQMRILTRLVEFCRAVGNSKSKDEILQQTVAVVADVTDCHRVSIMLPDEKMRFLEIVESIGVETALARSVKVPIGEPIAGQVFAAGRAIVVNTEQEAHTHAGHYDAPFFASVPLVSAPLDAGGRVVGVLNATEKFDSSPFQDRDREYIELISKVAGTAIHDLSMREARDQASDSIMVALAKLAEYRDNDTGKHLNRVTHFCLMLAETLREKPEYREEIDDEFLYNLERAVPLHDIGKVAIPDEVLLFPGRLNEEQMAIMRTHTIAGANTIQSLIDRAPGVCFLQMAMDIARYHHERHDGKGYPAGLTGKDIPLAARITAVADVYDALTTRRVYKEPFSHEKSATIIYEGSGTQFDPDVVAAFTQRETEFALLAQTMADDIQSQTEGTKGSAIATVLNANAMLTA